MTAVAGVQPGEAVLAEIAAGGRERERRAVPVFPEDAIAALERDGVLGWGAGAGERPPAAAELDLVRRIARADGSVGRIVDGHVNAVERLAVQAPPEVRERELALVAAGRLRAGVWGADPAAGEGERAAVVEVPGGIALRGAKVFCSGAGGLDRALVLARDGRRGGGDGPPLAAWVDVSDGGRAKVDETWFQGHGLRASVSHRVVFHDAPRDRAVRRPGRAGRAALVRARRAAHCRYVGRDGRLRGSRRACRARRPPRTRALEGLAVGRIGSELATIDLWIADAANAMDAAGERLATVSVQARDAIAGAARRLLDEAARACGSRPFATASALDRARRDLELFMLQHRLDPLVARAGEAELDAAGGPGMSVDFEARYRAERDPWGYETSAYERDKYAATLAACGPGPFARGLELGGSIGVFSALLASRCERLDTIDGAPSARRRRARAPGRPSGRARPRRRDPRRHSARPVRPGRRLRGPLLPR